MSADQCQYPNTCEKCQAAPFAQCRSLTTGKLTDTHVVRIQKQFESREDSQEA